MRRSRRWLAGLILAASASLWPGSAALAQPLKIAVSRTNLSLPLYVAQAQGLFAAAGLEVELLQCLGGVRCMAELVRGRADVATSTEIVGALQSFERSDFALIATFVGSVHDAKLLTRKSAGIASWADLAGKRIATVKGSSAQYYLDAALLFNGVPPHSIELVLLQPIRASASARSRASSSGLRPERASTSQPSERRMARADSGRSSETTIFIFWPFGERAFSDS